MANPEMMRQILDSPMMQVEEEEREREREREREKGKKSPCVFC